MVCSADNGGMTEIIGKITARAERKFDAGKDHFIARGILASLAIGKDDDIRQASNEAIVSMLEQRGAEGEVYAVRDDLSNGPEDSTDFVRVTSRRGVPTGSERRIGQSIVIRASSSDL